MKLSILVAAYQVEAFIEKCVKSCYSKNLHTEYEIIVVNDGSKDNTQQIVAKLCKAIPNLKLINKNNEGLGAARNTGIENAVGEYIWMIDGDDFIETIQLDSFFKELEQTKLDLYCMNYKITNKDGVAYNTAYSKEKVSEVYDATAYYQKFKANSYTWQYIFRKSIFVENQLLFKASINMQDSEIFPKIIYYSRTVKYLDCIGYNYVQHPNSFTNATNFQKRFSYFKSIIIVNNSLEKFKNKILGSNQLLAQSIAEKQESLHTIIFNHLIYFNYSDENLKNTINFLRENSFYPIRFSPKGKLKFVKFGINNFPLFTKRIIDKLRK